MQARGAPCGKAVLALPGDREGGTEHGGAIEIKLQIEGLRPRGGDCIRGQLGDPGCRAITLKGDPLENAVGRESQIQHLSGGRIKGIEVERIPIEEGTSAIGIFRRSPSVEGDGMGIPKGIVNRQRIGVVKAALDSRINSRTGSGNVYGLGKGNIGAEVEAQIDLPGGAGAANIPIQLNVSQNAIAKEHILGIGIFSRRDRGKGLHLESRGINEKAFLV